MKKLYKYLCIWYEGRAVRGLHVTPADIGILADIYNEKRAGLQSEFISGAVKTVLDACGIKTRARGIGWVTV